jgi:SAM-dependent methyltransferase
VIDRETIAVYDAKAEEYAGLISDIAEDSRLIDFIVRLPKGGQVLDLGCGPGNAAAEMARQGLQVSAWDASAEMVALAQRHDGVDAAQKLFDDMADLAPSSLDGLWANFSLLHAPEADMPRHLAAIASAVKPGGVFLIALKEGTGAHRDGIGRLYTYFTEDSLSALVEAAGFDVDRRDRGSGKGLSGEEAEWISLTCLRRN